MDSRRQQEMEDEALARRLMMEEMAGLGRGGPPLGAAASSRVQIQAARAACPFCGVENEYRAPAGPSPVALACGSCSRQFQATLPGPVAATAVATDVGGGGPFASPGAGGGGGLALLICRRCGTMNQYPSPLPGQPVPNVQCGSCGAMTPARRVGQRGHSRLAEQMFLTSAMGNMAHNEPLVRITVGGQRRYVPLRLLLALMNEQRNNSANESDIAALPTRKLEGGENLGDQTKCLICLEEFRHGDDIKTLPCLHIYHQACVERWLHTDNSCPVCKTPIGHGL